MTDALLPCPFCGSRDGIMPCDYRVTCRRCSATGPNGENVSQAMRLWDSRTPSPKLELPQEVREALERCECPSGNDDPFADSQVLAAFIRRIAGEGDRG